MRRPLRSSHEVARPVAWPGQQGLLLQHRQRGRLQRLQVEDGEERRRSWKGELLWRSWGDNGEIAGISWEDRTCMWKMTRSTHV